MAGLSTWVEHLCLDDRMLCLPCIFIDTYLHNFQQCFIINFCALLFYAQARGFLCAPCPTAHSKCNNKSITGKRQYVCFSNIKTLPKGGCKNAMQFIWANWPKQQNCSNCNNCHFNGIFRLWNCNLNLYVRSGKININFNEKQF